MYNNLHKLLREMISIPSPSFEEEKVCDHICSYLQDKGLSYERTGNNIIVRNLNYDPHKKTLMLCAHIDTVSPCEGYSLDPYCADKERAAELILMNLKDSSKSGSLKADDVIYGLGSNDDGASVVSMLGAMEHFYGNEMAVNLVLVLTCEEERSGSGGMTGLWGKKLCASGKAGDAGTIQVNWAIVGEPTGMMAATSERGLLVIDAEAKGKSAHAARSQEGVNALYVAMEDIATLKEHRFGKISSRMGEVALNVTQINAGSAHNVIPDSCSFVVDIRPTDAYTNEEILAELQALCKSGLKARNLKNRSSATFDGSLLAEIAGELDIETFTSATTSDWMRIDCDAVKMGPGDSRRSHKKDEYVLASEIDQAIDLYIRFIETLNKKETC